MSLFQGQDSRPTKQISSGLVANGSSGLGLQHRPVVNYSCKLVNVIGNFAETIVFFNMISVVNEVVSGPDLNVDMCSQLSDIYSRLSEPISNTTFYLYLPPKVRQVTQQNRKWNK